MKKLILLVFVLVVGNVRGQTCSASFTLYPDNNIPHLWYLVLESNTIPLQWTWDWGDGSFPDPSVVYGDTHTYSSPGYYNICVEIVNDTGCFAEYCDSSTYIYKTDAEIISVNIVDEIPSSIKEFSSLPLKLFPNPTTEKISIESPPNSGKLSSIVISDIAGNVVASPLTPLQGERGTVDVSTLSPGIYFVLVETDKLVFRQKFMKQ